MPCQIRRRQAEWIGLDLERRRVTTVAEVRRYFSMDQVDSFPGTAPGGAPSTVVSVAGEELVVEREGAVSAAELMQAWSPGTGS